MECHMGHLFGYWWLFCLVHFPENKNAPKLFISMKLSKIKSIVVLLGLIMSFTWTTSLNAQSSYTGSLDYSSDTAPKTTIEKLEHLKKRHREAFDELSSLLRRLPSEDSLLGSKELFSQIDKTDREMKSVKQACTSLVSSLRASERNIKEEKSYTENQANDLLESVNALGLACNDLYVITDLAVQRLSKAYAVVAHWKSIHKNTLNLQGAGKATGKVKVLVDEYLNSFTPEEKPEPEANGDAFSKPAAENNAGAE